MLMGLLFRNAAAIAGAQFVGKASAHDADATNQPLSVSRTVGAGNLLVAVGGWHESDTKGGGTGNDVQSPVISSALGHTFALIKKGCGSISGSASIYDGCVGMWYAWNSTGGAETVGLTNIAADGPTDNGRLKWLALLEYSGIRTGSDPLLGYWQNDTYPLSNFSPVSNDISVAQSALLVGGTYSYDYLTSSDTPGTFNPAMNSRVYDPAGQYYNTAGYKGASVADRSGVTGSFTQTYQFTNAFYSPTIFAAFAEA